MTTNATEQEYRRWTTAELKALAKQGATMEDRDGLRWTPFLRTVSRAIGKYGWATPRILGFRPEITQDHSALAQVELRRIA